MPKNAADAPAARLEVVPANSAYSATHDLTDVDPLSQHSSPECCDDQLNSPKEGLSPVEPFPSITPPARRLPLPWSFVIYQLPARQPKPC